jgi:hypothetical protein
VKDRFFLYSLSAIRDNCLFEAAKAVPGWQSKCPFDSGPAFVRAGENSHMATEKHKREKDPNSSAHDQAEKDMSKDPDLSDPDPTDDLDEGELADRDNSDEEALDYLERPRPRAHSGHPGEGHGGHPGEGHGGDADKRHGGEDGKGHEGRSGKGREK